MPAYHELFSASYRLRIRTTRRTAGDIAARAANPSAFVQCLRFSGVVCAKSNFARTCGVRGAVATAVDVLAYRRLRLTQ